MKPLLLCAACLLAFAGPGRAFAPAATLTVTNTNDAGAGSLRQAILDSNASAGVRDTIAFNIPAAGVQTITPTTPLPDLTDPVLINGQTQPGYDNVHPLIELDGSQLAAPNAVLTIASGTSEVYSLAITRGPDAGIRIKTAGGNSVGNCAIGTDPTGTIARGNATHGIVIENVPGNGVSILNQNRPNVIAGNGMHGVLITGAAATGNTVCDDAIGTDWTRTASVPNGGYGIVITDADSTNVEHSAIHHNGAGGILVQGAAVATTILDNDLSSNGGTGVTVLAPASGATIRGNLFHGNAGLGIDLGGDGRTPNDAGDVDGGANELLNFPILSNLTFRGHSNAGRFTNFTVRIDGLPNAFYQVYVYPGVPGNAPGNFQIYDRNVPTIGVTTDATGIAEFTGFGFMPTGTTAIAAIAVMSGQTSEISDELVPDDLEADSGACGGTGAEVLLPLLLLVRRRRRTVE